MSHSHGHAILWHGVVRAMRDLTYLQAALLVLVIVVVMLLLSRRRLWRRAARRQGPE